MSIAAARPAASEIVAPVFGSSVAAGGVGFGASGTSGVTGGTGVGSFGCGAGGGVSLV